MSGPSLQLALKQRNEGFERDALLLIESIHAGELTQDEVDFEGRELAKDYGIDSCTIWDLLAEIEGETIDCMAEVGAGA